MHDESSVETVFEHRTSRDRFRERLSRQKANTTTNMASELTTRDFSLRTIFIIKLLFVIKRCTHSFIILLGSTHQQFHTVCIYTPDDTFKSACAPILKLISGNAISEWSRLRKLEQSSSFFHEERRSGVGGEHDAGVTSTKLIVRILKIMYAEVNTIS